MDPLNGSAHLSEVLRGHEAMVGTLHLMTDLAVRSMPDCRAAVVSLLGEDGDLNTVASSGRTDADDHAMGEAARTGERQQSSTCLALPLFLQGATVGAFSMCREVPGPFRMLEGTMAEVFAEHVTVALANARLASACGRLAQVLYDGLAGSDDIVDQARGVLMEQRRCAAAEAADALEDQATRQGRTLDQVAMSVVAAAMAGR